MFFFLISCKNTLLALLSISISISSLASRLAGQMDEEGGGELTSKGRTSTDVLKSLSPGCSMFPLRKKNLEDTEEIRFHQVPLELLTGPQ